MTQASRFSTAARGCCSSQDPITHTSSVLGLHMHSGSSLHRYNATYSTHARTHTQCEAFIHCGHKFNGSYNLECHFELPIIVGLKTDRMALPTMPTICMVSLSLSSRTEMMYGCAVAMAASNSRPTLEYVSLVETLT